MSERDPASAGHPRVVLDDGTRSSVVARLGAEVSAAFPGGVVLVGVLKGAAVFLADLARAVTVPVAIDFLAISSYSPGSGRVRLLKDLELDVGGRAVVLVEDLIDTGLTATYLLNHLEARAPESVDVCALFDKAARRIVPVALRFAGVEVGDEFLLGYGMDWAGRYRNLRDVVAGDLDALRADPDAHVQALYSG